MSTQTQSAPRRIAVMLLLAMLVLPAVGAPLVSATAAPNGTATATPTATPTPTPSGNTTNTTSTNGTNTTNGTATATPGQTAVAKAPAPLLVEQEKHFNEPVSKRISGGRTVVSARGNWLELRLKGVNASEVRSASVEGDTARLTNKGDYWLFAAGHTDGSYRAVWVLQNGTRLEAVIKVTRTNLAHVPQDRWNEVQQDAQNWTAWEQHIIQLFGQMANVESQTEAAAEFLRFKADPFAYVLENPVSVATILVTTPSGIFISSLILSAFYGLFSGVARIANRWRRFSGDEATIDEKQDKIEQAQLESALEGEDLNNVFGHWIAERWRSLMGIDSVYSAFLVCVLPFLNRLMLRDRLKVMDFNGYRAKVVRSSPDGGEGDSADEGTIERVEIAERDIDPGESDEEYPEHLADLDDDAVAWLEKHGHEKITQFNMVAADDPRQHDLSTYDIEYDLQYDIDDISNELFERQESGFSKKEQAEQFGELLSHVDQSNIVDSEGNIRSLRVTLNGILRIFNLVGDRHGMPMVRVAKEQVQWLLNEHREEREIDEELNEIQAGNFDMEATINEVTGSD